MLHNANIYIAIVREIMHFLYMLKVVGKCSILLKKQKQKQKNVTFYKDNNEV